MLLAEKILGADRKREGNPTENMGTHNTKQYKALDPDEDSNIH